VEVKAVEHSKHHLNCSQPAITHHKEYHGCHWRLAPFLTLLGSCCVGFRLLGRFSTFEVAQLLNIASIPSADGVQTLRVVSRVRGGDISSANILRLQLPGLDLCKAGVAALVDFLHHLWAMAMALSRIE